MLCLGLKMTSLIEKLKGKDFRSIGRSNEVVELIFKNPHLFNEAFQAISDSDALVRMRAADVVEKVSKKKPQYLQPYKKELTQKLTRISQQEVRWHVAQMLSYLILSSTERKRLAKMLFSWIATEKSNIVKVMSLQTLSHFAKQEKTLKSQVIELAAHFLKKGSPSLKSRSRKILQELSCK